MDYDGDGFSETQVYSQRHNDGSRTVVSCENDKAFMGNDGKWVKQTFEYDANGNRVDE